MEGKKPNMFPCVGNGGRKSRGIRKAVKFAGLVIALLIFIAIAAMEVFKWILAEIFIH